MTNKFISLSRSPSRSKLRKRSRWLWLVLRRRTWAVLSVIGRVWVPFPLFFLHPPRVLSRHAERFHKPAAVVLHLPHDPALVLLPAPPAIFFLAAALYLIRADVTPANLLLLGAPKYVVHEFGFEAHLSEVHAGRADIREDWDEPAYNLLFYQWVAD